MWRARPLSPLAAKKISNAADVNASAGSANTNKAAQDLAPLATEWNNLRPSMSARSLSLNSDLLENTVDLVSRIEQATDKTCGHPTGLDWALLQLANYGSEVER